MTSGDAGPQRAFIFSWGHHAHSGILKHRVLLEQGREGCKGEGAYAALWTTLLSYVRYREDQWFSYFYVFFVAKGNLLRFYLL